MNICGITHDEIIHEINSQIMYTENVFYNLDADLEKVRMDEEIMKASAEYKVYYEHGTDDDLDYFYMEANNESETKRKGILDKAFSAILKLIESIIKVISDALGLSDKVDKSDKIVIPEQKVAEFKVIQSLFKKVIFTAGGIVILIPILKKVSDALKSIHPTKYSKSQKANMEMSIKEATALLHDTENMVKTTKRFIADLEKWDYTKEDEKIAKRDVIAAENRPSKDEHDISTIYPSKSISADISSIKKRWNDLNKRYKKAGIEMDPKLSEEYSECLTKLNTSVMGLHYTAFTTNNSILKQSKKIRVERIPRILSNIEKGVNRLKEIHVKADNYLKAHISNRPTTESVDISDDSPRTGVGVLKGLLFDMKTVLQLLFGIAGTILSALGKVATAISKK